MADRYLYVGEHSDTLSSGRPVAPGDRVPASALDEDADRRFLDDGLLIDAKAEAEEAKK
jgi:hypothetical protein